MKIFEAYTAAVASDLATKSAFYAQADVQERCLPVVNEAVAAMGPVIIDSVISELNGNMPRRVQYVDAARSVKELQDNMEQLYEFEVVKDPCELLKVSVVVDVSFRVEVIKKKRD